jgi:N-acetylglutamate synthase-like GNAT family acetyltransferase
METKDWQLGPATCRVRRSLAIPAHMRDGVREITKLRVPAEARKQGWASSLLGKITAEADRKGIVLVLWPMPFDDGPLDQAQLIAWYSKHGFEQIQPLPVLMARQPLYNPIGAAARAVAETHGQA